MKKTAKLLQSGKISSVELVQEYLGRIHKLEPKINAFITVDEEGALKQAQAADERRLRGEALSLWDGIPIALKDNISTQGLSTTCASRMLADYVPLYDATVVGLLKNAGLPILGKTNLDEFAMGSSTEYSAYGPTRNPLDYNRVAGGSSGGSAAAVAAGEAPWALGTDTGGSVRQPASFCGVVGLKPTYGRVSRYGIIATAPSLDHVGPMAKTVEDTAILFSLIAGPDKRDATSVQARKFAVPVWEKQAANGLKIGVPREFFNENLNPEVEEAVQGGLKSLEALGAQIVPISLAFNTYAIDTYITIVNAEASSSLARYDGVRYGKRVAALDTNTMFSKTRAAGFGREAKRRIMLGTYVLSATNYQAYYEKAQKVRSLIQQEIQAALQEVNLIITPTTPSVAFQIGEKRHSLEMYASDLYTVLANLSGIPALSLPAGMDSQALPMGIQLMAPNFQEELLLQVAHLLELNLQGGMAVE